MSNESTEPTNVIFINEGQLYKAIKNYIINEQELNIEQIVERIINSAVEKILNGNDITKTIEDTIDRKILGSSYVFNRHITEALQRAIADKLEIVIRNEKSD